ncbi:ZIP family metal transporter [[Mycoplasma] cavipharyngis]|uniref:ZIP family metal transporter n=1 Tax=[Mycoplasma] cavipharyngis TaxID=92757 RepID=UPI0037041655
MFEAIKISNNAYINYNLNALILSLIIISIPMLITVLAPILKPTLSKKWTMFLYSFTIGFFVVLGLFGEAPEGVEIIQANYADSLVIRVAIITASALLGLGSAFFLKYFMSKRLKMLNWNSEVHSHHIHDDQVHHHEQFHKHVHGEDFFLDPNLKERNLKSKFLAIYLLLSHRVAAGLILGFAIFHIVTDGDSISLLIFIGFFLHLIPEEFILYYRMRDMKIPRFRAMGYSALMTLLIVPFIFIGANIGSFITQVPWLEGMIDIIIGVYFAFVALFELLPEVVAEARIQKHWYIAISLILIGMLFAFFAVSFHGHHEEHANAEQATQLINQTNLVNQAMIFLKL